MFELEIYGRVRRAVRVEGRSQRAVAREFGLSRETVRKMLEFAVPPDRRQQPVRRPKLGPWIGVIDAILDDDRQRPSKQRHTAKQIFARLREEHQFTGGYTIVKDYVHTAMLRSQEMFVPLAHSPGEAQADFGEAEGALPGDGPAALRRLLCGSVSGRDDGGSPGRSCAGVRLLRCGFDSDPLRRFDSPSSVT